MSMMDEKPINGMLVPYRALDLTDEKGIFCGKVLGDLGCDVIKIEKPGGDRARRIGPFYHDICHPEKSLYWFAFNTNKRGITLDIETADGREISGNSFGAPILSLNLLPQAIWTSSGWVIQT